MGNHDNDPYGTSDFAAETPYREELGPVYYSMNIGKVHFLMLDNTVYLNNGGGPGVIGDRTYKKYFTQQQLDWIREDLKYVDKSTPIVVGFHCPIYTYGWNGTSTVRRPYQPCSAVSTDTPRSMSSRDTPM